MARGVIRSQPDRYAGTEMATIGLLSGYTTLILMGGGLMIFTLAATTSKVITVNTSTSVRCGAKDWLLLLSLSVTERPKKDSTGPSEKVIKFVRPQWKKGSG